MRREDENTIMYQLGWYIPYHFVWGPMRSKPCLTGEVAERLEWLIRERATELEIKPQMLVILPDRVYLAAAAPPTVSPHHIVCQLKAYTSRVLRDEFRDLTRIPTLWTRAYLVLAGEGVTPEQMLAIYQNALAPRRPRGRPCRGRDRQSDENCVEQTSPGSPGVEFA